jgi:hypothetical protein
MLSSFLSPTHPTQGRKSTPVKHPPLVCVFRRLVRLRIVRDALSSAFPGLQRAPIFCVLLCSMDTHQEPIAMMASWCYVFAEHRSIPRLLIV